MTFRLSDRVIADFLSGILALVAILAVGAVLAFALKFMSKRYHFTRLGLVLGLAPLSMVSFLEYRGRANFFLFSMFVILLGVTIDGLAYLFHPPLEEEPEEEPEEEAERKLDPVSAITKMFQAKGPPTAETPKEEPPAEETPIEEAPAEPKPGVIIWEKAE